MTVVVAGTAVGRYQRSMVAKPTAGRLATATVTTENDRARPPAVTPNVILAEVRQIMHVVVRVRITVVVLLQEKQLLLLLPLQLLAIRCRQLVGPLGINLPVDMAVRAYRPENYFRRCGIIISRHKICLRVRFAARRV